LHVGGAVGGAVNSVRITSNTGGVLTVNASGSGRPHVGGAAIGGNHRENAGNITIDGDVRLNATANRNTGAGIGGGYAGTGGAINIGGHAVVDAHAAGSNVGGTGIGGGGGAWQGADAYIVLPGGAGGVIKIGGSAQVKAVGDTGGAGIGSGNFSGSTPENTIISITGSARVYALGNYGSAGIGGGAGLLASNTAGAKITIGSGTDCPIVIAKSGDLSEITIGGPPSVKLYPSAIGAGGARNANGRRTEIDIKSGFVVAKYIYSTYELGQDIDGGTNGYVRISGGSVYTAHNSISPAPTNSGTTWVYPLYTSMTGFNNKTISIPSIGYTAKALPSEAAVILSGGDTFFGNDFTGMFSTDISGMLWVPEGSYTGVTANGAGPYTATVLPSIMTYSSTMQNNRLQ
jgi:hypothetical protein